MATYVLEDLDESTLSKSIEPGSKFGKYNHFEAMKPNKDYIYRLKSGPSTEYLKIVQQFKDIAAQHPIDGDYHRPFKGIIGLQSRPPPPPGGAEEAFTDIHQASSYSLLYPHSIDIHQPFSTSLDLWESHRTLDLAIPDADSYFYESL